METQTAPKKRLPFIIILLIALTAFCIFCIIASFTMDALGLLPTPTPSLPPTITPLPTQTALPTPTTDPAIQLAQQYAKEYDGSYDVYYEIFTSNDCAFLQEKFDIAYEANENAEAGTIYHKRSLGFMLASDERMKEIDCY